MLCSAYGLILHTNRTIPGLHPILGSGDADVDICFGGVNPQFERAIDVLRCLYSSEDMEDGIPTLRVYVSEPDDFYRFRYADGTEFVVDQKGTKVWARWASPLTLEDTAVYLLGPILGFVLLLRGTTCLHASSVAVGVKALALVGPAGAGKSTTSAALSELGFPVLSEDVVALHNNGKAFLVQPGYPGIRLWPSSVRSLYGASDALPLMTPNWEKRWLDLSDKDSRFQSTPLELGAIYVLQERILDPAAPHIAPLNPKEGLVSLVGNTYVNYLKNKSMRADEFRLLARVAMNVPLRKLVPHASVDRILALCEAVVRDFETLAVDRAPGQGRIPGMAGNGQNLQADYV